MSRALAAAALALLAACSALEGHADCAAAQHGGKTLMCCDTGPGLASAHQWRCAFVHVVQAG